METHGVSYDCAAMADDYLHSAKPVTLKAEAHSSVGCIIL